MKRSEMLDKLRDAFVRRTMCESNLLNLTPTIICEHLLQVIEEQGMLPPKSEIKMGDKVLHDYYWEPEE